MKHLLLFCLLTLLSAIAYPFAVARIGLLAPPLIIIPQIVWLFIACNESIVAWKILRDLLIAGAIWTVISVLFTMSPFSHLFWFGFQHAGSIGSAYLALRRYVRISWKVWAVGTTLWIIAGSLAGFLNDPVTCSTVILYTLQTSLPFWEKFSQSVYYLERQGLMSGYLVAIALFTFNLPILNIYRFGRKPARPLS